MKLDEVIGIACGFMFGFFMAAGLLGSYAREQGRAQVASGQWECTQLPDSRWECWEVK